MNVGVQVAAVQIENLSLCYVGKDKGQHVLALDDVKLDVGRNEFLTILGPSGCGKSTLLFAVAGFLKPTAGRILVNGVEVRRPGRDRGIVFQDYALLPWLTASKNISLGPKLQGASKAERQEIAREYLELFDLNQFADKYPHELSGGMRQRVAVARTLAGKPDVVLMDEPFGALDAQTRDVLAEELARISVKHKMTVIFVTHSIDEAVLLGDNVVVMSPRPGRVDQTFRISIPRDLRTASALRDDDQYLSLVRQVGDAVRSVRSTGR